MLGWLDTVFGQGRFLHIPVLIRLLENRENSLQDVHNRLICEATWRYDYFLIDGRGEKIVVITKIIFKGKRSISWKELE